MNADGNGLGKVAISAKDTTIENSTVTASNTGSVDMKAGEGVSITTSNLNLMNHAQVSSNSSDSGSGGNVDIKASGNIEVKTGSVISSHSLAGGKGGEVNVTAASLNLDGKDQSDKDFTGIAANANPNSTSLAGKVNVQVDSLNIENGAQMNSSTFGEGDANSVTVSAKNITIDGKGSAFATGIGSNANPDSSGHAGNIAVTAENISIKNGGTINSMTSSSGDAGSVQIDAKTVAIDGQNNKNKVTGISSDTNGSSGNAGKVGVNAKQLTIKNYGTISSNTFSSRGKGGVVKVKSDDIYINGYANDKPIQLGLPSGILANTTGIGNAGDVSVDANTLTIIEEGRVASNTYGSGKGGNVNVQAKNIVIDGNTKATPILVDNDNKPILDQDGNIQYKPVSPTGIESNTLAGSTGDAGSVKINASNILIEEGGRIASYTRGQGGAGNVFVNAGSITIDSKIYKKDDFYSYPVFISGIAAAASPASTGKVGNIDIAAGDLVIKNNGQISIQNRAIVEHPEITAAGTISIKAGDIYLQNYSLINAQSTVNADAGNIHAQISRGLWLNNSAVTTQAETGNGGAILINSGNCIDMVKSIITTSVKSSTGNGGNITVSSPNLVLDDGVIQANAYSGRGGDVLLVIDSLVGNRQQVQQAGKKIDIFLPSHKAKDEKYKGKTVLQIEDANTKMWDDDDSNTVRNVIQAASEHGLSGQVNVTSPQINLSGVLAGLSTAQFDPNILRQDYCAIGTGSSLTNKGYGALPAKSSDLLY